MMKSRFRADLVAAGLTALLGAVLLFGCGANRVAQPNASRPAEERGSPVALRLDALAPLFRRSTELDFEVEVIDPGRLPEVEPFSRPSPRERLPQRLRALEGIRVSIDGATAGFAYAFRSQAIARAAAPSFLSLRSEVQGCGRILYFTKQFAPQQPGQSDDRWLGAIVRVLRDSGDCRDGVFTVIS